MILDRFKLTNKVALIQGAGHGMGKAVANAFAEAGADVAVAGINLYDTSKTDEVLEATAAEVRAHGRKALVIPADVRIAEQVDAMVQKTVAEFGRIDILMNSAGGTFFSPSLELTEKGFDAVVRENLKTVFLCSQGVGRVMKEKGGGSIISVSSISGQVAHPGNVHYAASKAAIIHLTRTLGVEWAPYRIRVNAIAPSVIKTHGWQHLHRDDPDAEARAAAKIPWGRLGTPEDIAALVLFLASDASDYITGQTIDINGGALYES